MGTVKMLLFKILPFLSFAAADYWPNLRVTFGLNPFGNAFYPYPITESEAIAAGREKIGTCGDPIWLGERYADPSDPALVLIYDQAGYIAGSQSGMLASNVGAIIDRPPTCISDLLEYPGLSTMHHYFYSM